MSGDNQNKRKKDKYREISEHSLKCTEPPDRPIFPLIEEVSLKGIKISAAAEPSFFFKFFVTDKLID